MNPSAGDSTVTWMGSIVLDGSSLGRVLRSGVSDIKGRVNEDVTKEFAVS